MKDFYDLFDDCIWYPENELLLNGVLKNTCYQYVSYTYLNGLINYVEKYEAIMIERYEHWWDERKKYETKYEFHTKFSNFPDDIIVFAESDNDYWFFWGDCDCSDCKIGRIDKSRVKDLKEFKELFIKYIEDVGNPEPRSKDCEHITGRYINLKKPDGWISFR